MYDIFEQLLQKYGITSYKVSKQTGVTQTSLSNWKSGRNTPSMTTLSKLADFFGVTVDYLMTGEEESEKKETSLTPKDERDIAKKVDKMMKEIEDNTNGPLYYNGEEIDEASLSLLKDALEMAMKHIKPINKEKYNPNKNKK